MVQELVLTLERHRETAWLVWMTKVLAGLTARFYGFLDNERAFVHAGTTSVLMFFGLKLAWPGSTFGTAPQGYSWFVGHWPYSEQGWASLLILVATISYSALFVRYREPTIDRFAGRPPVCWQEVYQILCGGLLLSAHVNLAWGFFHGNPLGTATFTYTIIGIFSAWVIYRIQRKGGIWT